MDVNSCKDSEWVDMMKWVLPAAGVKFLVKDFKKKDDIIAKFVTLPNVWTSYIPPRGATLENATCTRGCTNCGHCAGCTNCSCEGCERGRGFDHGGRSQETQ